MAPTSPQFLSNDFSHPRHRRALTALIVAVLVFGVVIVAYLSGSGDGATSPPDPLTARRALMEQPNPPANLTPAEIQIRRKILTAPNPPAKLTPSQIQARQSALSNI